GSLIRLDARCRFQRSSFAALENLRWKPAARSFTAGDAWAIHEGFMRQDAYSRGVILARTRAGSIVTLHRLLTAIWLAGFFALCAMSSLRAGDAMDGSTQLAQAQPQPTPAPAATPAPSPSPDANAPADQQTSSDEPIGNVASLTGIATVIRNKDSISLKLKDDIYLNDTVQTAASSSLGITFNDATTFHLSANAKITIDTYVYADGGSNNNGVFDIAKGTVAFVAAAVARTGNMQITTPTATLG